MVKKAKISDISVREMSCSQNWYVTGYYTSAENEFSGALTEIAVKDFGTDQFPSGFLSAVRMEGWGQTRHGWFLGWAESGQWIKGDAALNALGEPLRHGVPGKPNSLAVDRHVIPIGTQVRIPNLPAPWNTILFVADDTGGAIIGKHVDVYCGTGKAAKEQTNKVTTHQGQVCLG